MLFVVFCTDKADSVALRMATRPTHLDYLGAHPAMVKVGGPYLNDKDEPIGSMLVIEAADKGACEAFVAADPYALAGLFETVIVRPWRFGVGGGLTPA
jgi:uncharacterized protein YciI